LQRTWRVHVTFTFRPLFHTFLFHRMYTKRDYRGKHNFPLLPFLSSHFLFYTLLSLSQTLLFGELGLSYFLARLFEETSHSPSYRNPHAFSIRWENEIMLNDDGDSTIFKGPPVFIEAPENKHRENMWWKIKMFSFHDKIMRTRKQFVGSSQKLCYCLCTLIFFLYKLRYPQKHTRYVSKVSELLLKFTL